MKKFLRLICLFLACALFLTACGDPKTQPASQSVWPSQGLLSRPAESSMQVRLYFRYGDSPFLSAEERTLVFGHHETPEKAIVQALLDGPSAQSAALRSLFPPDTRILSVQKSEDTLFLTFSQEMLGRYADEPGGIGNEEFIQRRRLCTDALVNTLTEANLCARVQILVQQDSAAVTSLRLPASFYRATADSTPLGTLKRNESVILTPYNTARLILDAWMRRHHKDLYSLLASADQDGTFLPDTETAYAVFDEAPVLTAFNLSSGVVSSNGRRVVLSCDLFIQSQGQDVRISAYPVHLVLENGLWKIQYSQLLRLFNAHP